MRDSKEKKLFTHSLHRYIVRRDRSPFSNHSIRSRRLKRFTMTKPRFFKAAGVVAAFAAIVLREWW
jgi:hypothetical protein